MKPTLKMLFLCSALFTASALFSQSTQSSGSNANPKDPGSVDDHSPFPTDKGMTTPATGPKNVSTHIDVPETSKTNKAITTKNAKVATKGDGTNIINDRKGASGSQGTTGGNPNSQLPRQ